MGRGHLKALYNADAPSPLMIFLSCSPTLSSGLDALADGLDGALEAGGSLELQLVGHGVDLEPVQPVKTVKHVF